MRSVHRRLAKLEDGSGPCSVCGLDQNAKVRYIIHWDWEDEDEPSESSPPCPRCGQRAIIVVSWPDPPGSSEERARLEAQHEEALAASPWLGGEDTEPPNADPVPDTRRGPERGEGTSYESV